MHNRPQRAAQYNARCGLHPALFIAVALQNLQSVSSDKGTDREEQDVLKCELGYDEIFHGNQHKVLCSCGVKTNRYLQPQIVQPAG
jgi:hypothetical protein